MLWVLAILGVAQILEFFVCGVSLMTLFSILPRVLFCMRMAGTVVSMKTLATLEGVGLGVWIVWRGFIVRSLTIPKLIVFTLCVAVSIIIYAYDTASFVYVVEDDKTEQ